MEVKLKQYPTPGSNAMYSCDTFGLEFEYVPNNNAVTAIISSPSQGIGEISIPIPEEITFEEDGRILPVERNFFGKGTVRVSSVQVIKGEGILKIELPKSVESVIIQDVKCKIKFEVSSENPYFCCEDGSLYNKAKSELIHYFASDWSMIVLPDSIKTIYDHAFSQLRIQKLTLPAGIKEVSFKRLGAASIQEVDCKGNITKIIGTPSDSTPRKMRVNSYMHDITWEDYELYRSYINPRIVITKLPIIKETSKMEKRMIRLHEVIATDKAMKYKKDFSPLVIAVNPDAKFINSEQMEDGTHHVDINMDWIVVVREEPIETYKGIHNGSKIRFVDKESNSGSEEYKVFESVEEVQHLIQNCLL